MNLRGILAAGALTLAAGTGLAGCHIPPPPGSAPPHDICAFSNPYPGTNITGAVWNGHHGTRGRWQCRSDLYLNPFGPVEWCVTPGTGSPPDDQPGRTGCDW